MPRHRISSSTSKPRKRLPSRKRNAPDTFVAVPASGRVTKRKASKTAAPAKKKARSTANAGPTTGYKGLVMAAVQDCDRGGVSHTQIHAAVKAAKDGANSTYVTKAIRALIEDGQMVPTKKHPRKFVAAAAAPKAVAKKTTKGTKKTKGKQATKGKKKTTKGKQATKGKKTTKKTVAAAVPAGSYKAHVLEAVQNCARGGVDHRGIHAAVKAAKSGANSTFITKAVRALVESGHITPTKKHQRKFVVAKPAPKKKTSKKKTKKKASKKKNTKKK